MTREECIKEAEDWLTPVDMSMGVEHIKASAAIAQAWMNLADHQKPDDKERSFGF